MLGNSSPTASSPGTTLDSKSNYDILDTNDRTMLGDFSLEEERAVRLEMPTSGAIEEIWDDRELIAAWDSTIEDYRVFIWTREDLITYLGRNIIRRPCFVITKDTPHP